MPTPSPKNDPHTFGFNDIVGINADLQLYEGYDTDLGTWVHINPDDAIQLADIMMERWAAFKTAQLKLIWERAPSDASPDA